MRFRQRILLDRLLAVPLAVALNGVVRLLGKALRRDHTITPAATRQIVVCKLVGMGSVLQATPLLRALRQQFPQAHITFVTLRGNRELLKRVQGVDEVLCLDDRSAFAMLLTTATVVLTLACRRVDQYLDLEVYSGFTCLLSLFSLARNRLGFYRHSNRFKRGIYTHLVYFNTRMPVRKTYLQLGRLAGIAADFDDLLGPVHIGEPERLSMQQKLAGLGLKPGQPYILVNSNASDLLVERRWPKEYFIASIQRLAELGYSVVLMGSKSEAGYVASIFEAISPPLRALVFDTSGMLTLGELLALIESASCILTNDTGPMHMAFALQKSIVCLFGPGDPIHYGLDGPQILILYAPVPCSPCIYEVDIPPCAGNNICMQRLSSTLVVDSVLSLVAPCETSQPKVAVTTRLPLIWNSDSGNPLGAILRA